MSRLNDVTQNILLVLVCLVILATLVAFVVFAIVGIRYEQNICKQTFGEGWEYRKISRTTNACAKNGELKYL